MKRSNLRERFCQSFLTSGNRNELFVTSFLDEADRQLEFATCFLDRADLSARFHESVLTPPGRVVDFAASFLERTAS